MKEKGCSEAEGSVMDGGMIGVVKEGTRHDNEQECVHICMCKHTCVPCSLQHVFC